MKRETSISLFARAAATLPLMERRAATALLLMLLTTATAWADGYDYIDADGKLKNTATDDNTANDWVNNIGGGDFTILNGWNIVTSNGLLSIGDLYIDSDVHLILSFPLRVRACFAF